MLLFFHARDILFQQTTVLEVINKPCNKCSFAGHYMISFSYFILVFFTLAVKYAYCKVCVLAAD